MAVGRAWCIFKAPTKRLVAPLTWHQRQLYDRSTGVPRSFIALLSQEHDISDEGIRRWMARKAHDDLRSSQRYLPDRVKVLGHDLAAAHFIVKRGGKVRLCGVDRWFSIDKDGRVPLPGRETPGYSVEAIDASGTDILYEGLENFFHLRSIKYLSLRQCKYVDDWCISRLHHLESLMSLDLSDNDKITERGLLSLHNLPNLRKLKLENVKHLQGRPLAILMLEELLSNCILTGINYTRDPMQKPR